MMPAPVNGSAGATVGAATAQAIAFHRDGRLADAERIYRSILAAVPQHFDALHLLGVLAVQHGRLEEGVRLIGQALAVNPHSAQAHANIANALQRLGRHADSLAACDLALALAPADAEVHNTRGLANAGSGRYEEAIASYDRALAAAPRHAAACANRGPALSALGRHAEAIDSLDRALAIDPSNANAHANRGHALRALARYDEAIAAYGAALAIEPARIDALEMRGFAFHYLGRNVEAVRDFADAAALDPTRGYAKSMQTLLRAYNCDWNGREVALDALTAAVRTGTGGIEPFVLAVLSDQASDQLACAAAAVRTKVPPAAVPLWSGERYAHERIRVAYLSDDYREHATAYLIAELIERHDRSRFEVAGLSWSTLSPEGIGSRIARAFDHFVDVGAWSDAEAARWLREQEYDIVVDLKGFTNGSRPRIFAARPAPVQVNFLGYPGTLGAPYFDYIVADATVIPESAQADYAERVLYLPDTYQPNDRKREISATIPARAQCGLPETGFVFCSFNGTYKITPAVFDIWMRLLARVDGSVLWLLEGGASATANLRREAQVRGVDPSRIVFASRAPLPDHLARHANADLFLDTLPCNAHTTASDALWTGLPVLTCLGTTFAGRVAGSLVRAAGLPELVTESLADYEALALRLATETNALAEVRDRLAAQRVTCALFDSERYCRNLEGAYAHMVERARSGRPPETFRAGLR